MHKQLLAYSFIIILMFASMPKAAYAGDQANVTVNISDVIILEFQNSPTGDGWHDGDVGDPFNLDTFYPGLTQFNQGDTGEESFEIRVSANCNWMVKVHGDDLYFGYTTGAWDQKPREDIWIQDGSGWDGFYLSNTKIQILPGPTEGWGSPGWHNGDQDEDYMETLSIIVDLSWADDLPGIYTYPVIFTLVAQ